MKRFMVVFGVIALLVFPRLVSSQCSPNQFSEPYGWLIGGGPYFDPASVAGRIGEALVNAGVRVRDASFAKPQGLYERYDLYVSQLSYQGHPGWWEADLLVSISDWQGKMFRPGTPPAFSEPCESPRLLHSKRWHVSSQDDSTYQAVVNYYFNNRNAIPSEFMKIPALTPLGLAGLIALMVLCGVYFLGRQSLKIV